MAVPIMWIPAPSVLLTFDVVDLLQQSAASSNITVPVNVDVGHGLRQISYSR